MSARYSTTRGVTRTAVRLGLWTTMPRRRPRYRPSHAHRAAAWAGVGETVRLLLAPGLVYFAFALAAGMAIAFLVGLWLL
ncbi:MAG: hypothetical protein ACRD0K_28240 [Egibacteraceae bacterium]